MQLTCIFLLVPLKDGESQGGINILFTSFISSTAQRESPHLRVSLSRL